MRGILFRGKDDESKDFVYGLLSLERDCRNPKMLCTVKPCIVWEESGLLYSSFVIPETVGQYTGLTDKNGNKIFEGDIISIPFEEDRYPYEENVIYYENAEVYFDTERYGWYVKYLDDDSLSIWGYDDCDIAVIGNIHDDPELMKGGEG